MRRLALLLVLGPTAFASAQKIEPGCVLTRVVSQGFTREDSSVYLKLRAGNGIVQASGSGAVREVKAVKTLEIQGHVSGSCQSGDTTVLIFQHEDGQSQEVEARAPPAWLLEQSGTVRLLVRCERRKSGALRATLLAAASELDIVQVEEAYWNRVAQQRAALKARTTGSSSLASRGGTTRGGVYGRIGGRSYSTRGSDVRPPREVADRYADFIRRYNPRLAPAQAMRIAEAVVSFSLREKFDMRLVMAVIIVESGFNPNAVSRVGAVGLGQLMPGTARGLGVRNSYDTTDNLAGSIRLLSTHWKMYKGDVARTLAAYNAGAGAVRRHGGVPPYRETQNYVLKVVATYRKLCGQ